MLRPLGWQDKNLEAELNVFEIKGKSGRELKSSIHHGSHKVDYIKGRIAFDLEWNSKDQTFDRDLYAFRAFFEYDAISLGILVTRSNELDPLFKELGIKPKYGTSTTHMGKLIPRLIAGRNGGCPVIVFGITTKLLVDE
ncbi:MAG: BglII/BstYI family type II restriction endonuclease [Bacteroidales bacterium]